MDLFYIVGSYLSRKSKRIFLLVIALISWGSIFNVSSKHFRASSCFPKLPNAAPLLFRLAIFGSFLRAWSKQSIDSENN